MLPFFLALMKLRQSFSCTVRVNKSNFLCNCCFPNATSSRIWELWGSEILGTSLHAFNWRNKILVFSICFSNEVFIFLFSTTFFIKAVVCHPCSAENCLSLQNIQLMLVKIKMTKYCVQINNNNGCIFGKKPHDCPSPKQSVACSSACLVILSPPEEDSFLSFVVCAKLWNFHLSNKEQICVPLDI